jgi:hypothetical protein
MMVRTLLIAAALLAALGKAGDASEQAGSQAAAKKQGDPSGVYLCEGTNPDGHRYRGIVQIAAIEDTFLVRWTLSDDIEVTGVGILRNDTLSVSYFGGTPAVVVYKVDAEKLVGEWTMGGADGKTYGETLTRVPEGSITIPKQQERPRRRPGRSEPVAGTISI